MPFARFLLLVAALFATPAFADRATLAAGLCAPAIPDRGAALTALAEAGATGGTEEARWAQAVVAAVEERTLRCSPSGTFIGEGDAALDAATLSRAPAPTDAAGLPVNNRVRATAASASAILTLFAATDDPAARASSSSRPSASRSSSGSWGSSTWPKANSS